ncbi:hypothetical protein EIN43_08810 [Enterobacter hormaechei]|uniref:Uncharacterized protein n=1 Tax=Enterobacter hormaechei TaxID=158836 RepID=A0A4Y5ZNS9_9ENTR|nr:hypothetical protein EIN43_08810 [Enterobacter hormaechei]
MSLGNGYEKRCCFTVRELLKVNGGKGFTTGRGISTEELNYLMLYWDKLVSPTNNIIHISLANEEELENCGVLYRPKFTQQGVWMVLG